MFDSAYYISEHPDSLDHDGSILDHYEKKGVEAGHRPNFWFDVRFYRERYADIPNGDFDTLLHYLTHGARERRTPHMLFDHAWYIVSNPDIPNDGVDGLSHFVQFGESEGRDPHPLLSVAYLVSQCEEPGASQADMARRYLAQERYFDLDPCEAFDTAYYRREASLPPDVNPLIHYLSGGWRKHDPNPYFSAAHYLGKYEDVRSEGINPFLHYMANGHHEGRSASDRFDTAWYKMHYTDVVSSGLNPLSHFMRFGLAEERHPVPPAASGSGETMASFDPTLQARLKEQAFLRSNKRLAFRMDKAPVVSIILVLYNKSFLTLDCLESLVASIDYDETPYEIVVYDNGSTDNTHLLRERVSGLVWITDENNSGFILGVNNAFDHAKGAFVLLLNNDTQVLSGAVTRAHRLMEEDGTIGAVGAKLILPTGLLQEAGSIIWSDGSCLGYARGKSPEAYEANFQRDVDYASGAFLLIRASLFAKLGKLDEIYRPAYYEETDLCAKIHAAGLRVVYDPDVEVFHLEFGSAASQKNAVQQQEKNQAIFLRQNPAVARHHPPSLDNVLRARFARNDRPNLLIIDDKVPFPELGSGFPRSQGIVNAIAARGFNATFLPTDDSFQDWRIVRRALDGRIEVAFGYHGDTLAEHLAERRDYYDVLLVSRPHNMERVNAFLEANPKVLRRVLVIYDAEALFSQRDILKLALDGMTVDVATAASMLWKELAIARHARMIVTVSETEGAHFATAGKDIVKIGHQIEPKANPPGFTGRKDILFVGGTLTDDTPNTDSMVWFIDTILPRIRAEIGDVTLHLVGSNRSAAIDDRLCEHIIAHGRVDDVSEFYDRCRIFVAPTRFAAGIPHKVHEAAAEGLPCVVTDLLARQLGWSDGEVLTASESAAFAAQCIRLYCDRTLWETTQTRALEAIVKDCSMAEFDRSIERMHRYVLANIPGRVSA